jgi:hypothetical protein
MESIARGLGFPYLLSNPMIDYFLSHLDTQETKYKNISQTSCYAHNNVPSFEKRGGA